MADYRDFQNAALDLYVDQGSDFMQTITLRDTDGLPLDLTGYTMSVVIKKYFNVSFTYAATCSIIGDPLLGTIKIEIPETTSNSFTASRYVYLVHINNQTTGPVKVLDGQILVDRF